MDTAAVLLHYTVADTKPKSHSLSDVFGSKKRIEDFVKVFRRDSLAIVSDHNEALPVFFAAANPDRCCTLRRRFFLQGLQGILQQVDQNLGDLIGIGPDGLGFR